MDGDIVVNSLHSITNSETGVTTQMLFVWSSFCSQLTTLKTSVRESLHHAFDNSWQLTNRCSVVAKSLQNHGCYSMFYDIAVTPSQMFSSY